MEVIKINDVKDVEDVYTTNKVNDTRVKGLHDKFQAVPDEFTVFGLCFPTLKIGKKTIPNVPAFAINEDGSKYVPVGTFRQSWTDKTTASQITKEGANKDKFLVVNNKRVHPLSEGLSEAEIVAYVQGKTFKASKAKEYPVFSPEYGETDSKPIYAETEKEALEMIKVKSYRVITEKK